MSAKLFAPGSVVATPGALEALRASGDDPLVCCSDISEATGETWTSTIGARTNSPSSLAGGFCPLICSRIAPAYGSSPRPTAAARRSSCPPSTDLAHSPYFFSMTETREYPVPCGRC